MREPVVVNVAQLPRFDEVIDVRSEGEFAEDHIPGAISCPVLDNAERAQVGTIYKQRSPFEARKIGASLVSANIARHLRERFTEKPRDWRPLVYCWRGGERSGAFAHVLSRIGWQVGRLEGGYRNYRRTVIAELDRLPDNLRLRVICGLTGTGKSRLLQSLRGVGAQVLDLEALAGHRGSLLGDLPGEPQPSQKMFESLIWNALSAFDPQRPVYVESESKKIGALRVPPSLIGKMWQSECVLLESPVDIRVALLRREYGHFLDRPDSLLEKLAYLVPLHGHAVIDHWKALVQSRSWNEVTADLLVRHYDPAYTRAITSHYPALSRAVRLRVERADDATFDALARLCVKSEGQPAQVAA